MVLAIVSEEELDALGNAAGPERPQMVSAFYYSDLPDPHEWLDMWTCGSDFIAEGIGYCNPKYDELVTRMNSELDPAKRLRPAEAAGRLLVADAPSIFVYNPTNVWLVKPSVTGYSRFAPNHQWPGWWNPLALDIVYVD
jgi:ABC-type oligopeptide transport system substrate-binding subunit